MKIKRIFVNIIKKTFHVKNLTLYFRKKKHSIQKLIYKKKYNTFDIIRILQNSGVQPGRPIIVHCAFGNLYNFEGTADELIDALLDYIGSEGTLCMPAYPKDKYNNKNTFDVLNTKSAAGYLSEVFRKRNGVKRSLNQLHSVCAFGKDADYIVNDHVNSRICFDEHSPFYKIGQLGGYIVDLGLPEYYIGTGCHVCEALLFDEVPYFQRKFTKEIEFTYKDAQGRIVKHKMLTKASEPYVRDKSTSLIDTYFDNTKYKRTKLSNMWINVFDMKYLYTRLSELALEKKCIYKYPKM